MNIETVSLLLLVSTEFYVAFHIAALVMCVDSTACVVSIVCVDSAVIFPTRLAYDASAGAVNRNLHSWMSLVEFEGDRRCALWNASIVSFFLSVGNATL